MTSHYSSGSLPNYKSRSDIERKASSTSFSSYSNQRKMTNTVRASNKAAILAVGEELRQLLHEEDPPLIKDRRYHLKSYDRCFVGHDMVDWLLKKGEVESRKEAVAMMQKLLDHGVLHHVCDDHFFKDDKLFYRFRKDDGTYIEPADAAILAKGQRLYGRIRGEGSQLVQDRKYHLHVFKQCFVGRELVDWLIAKGEASTRGDAVELGKNLLEAGVFKHVVNDHHFKDEFLFYRFKNDEKQKSPKLRDRLALRKGSSKRSHNDDTSSQGDPNEDQRASGGSWDSSSGEVNTPPKRSTPELDEYVQMQSPSGSLQPPSPLPSRVSPQPPPSSSPSPSPGSIRSNGSITSAPPTAQQRPSIEQLTDPLGPYIKRKIDIVSDPVGYGFVIRGSRPVYVHTIDPSGPAAAAGLKVGEYLYSVNGQVVLNASHTDAARIILMGSSTASLVTFVEK